MTEREIFLEALDMATPEARAAYLQGACGRDVTLRRKVDELLKEHYSNDSLLAGPAFEGERAAEADTLVSEAPAQMIGRYKLLEKIGEGGFGEVWMAEQREPVKRRVALKIIKPGLDSRQIVARFEAERQALAMMDHTNIARIFDADVTDTGRLYFVMELVRGIKITEYCDQNQLPTRERLRLFIKVCQAIQHAHQKGIIHRDIKPSNILVTLHDGVPVPKVIDFGIAKATQEELTDKTVFTQFQQFIGTPAYISPEQAKMSGLDIDTRADIYSLGVLLYELLVGQTPFDAKEMMKDGLDALRLIIREREPLRPSTKLNTLPGDARTTAGKRRQTEVGKLVHQLQGDLDWIVMKCLEKDRTRRYETANGLALDIQRFLNNEPVSATPPSASYRFRKFARRNRIALRVAMLLVLATLLSTWQAIRASRGQAVANAATEQLREKLREAAQSHRFAARELARQGRYRDALVRLAQACEYAPESTAAAEQAVALGNASDVHSPIATLTGHKGEVNSAQFSPDGLWIVTASPDTTARVWEVESGRLIATLTGHKGEVNSAQFSPDGLWIVTASSDTDARLWETATGRCVAPLTGHQGLVRGARFSPDGSRVVTISNDGTARVWDVRTGGLVATLSGHEGLVDAGRFSPDGVRVVTGSDVGEVRVWNASTGQSLTKLEGHTGRVSSAAFSPDGSRIVTASWDQTGRVWDAVTGKHIATLSGHQNSLISAEFSPDGTRIVTSSDDRSGRVWDAATGRLIATLSGHQDRLKSAEFSPDGRRIVTGSHDKTARVWEAATGRLVSTLGGHRGIVWSAQFSPDGARVVTASADGTARVWDMSRSRPSAILSGHQHRVWNAQFSPDGARILTNSDDRTARVWDADSGQPVVTFSGHRKRVWTAQFNPDGTRVVTASLDKTARLWDATTGLPIATLAGHQAGVGSAQFSPDGSRLVTASDDKTARVWDASTGRLITTLTGHGSFVWNAQFSPDGTRVVTSSHDLTARIWEVPTGRLIATLSGWTDDVWILPFSPDGARIATASYDGTARVWNAVTGEPILTLPAMPPILRSIQFSPDGARLVTASDDKFVRLWDAATGRLIAELSGHRDRARTAQFSRDGKRLVSSCFENVFVWDAITGQLIVGLTEFRDPVYRAKRSFDGARKDSATGPLIPDDFGEGPHVSDPLCDHRQRINSAQFSPDGGRIVTSSDDKTARVWELLGTHEPPPPWFSDFLRVIALGTLNANGELDDLPVNVWLALRTKVLEAMKSDTTRYGDIARYYLTPGSDRPVRPGSKITCHEAADSLISPDATKLQLERAYALDPTHTLIQLALARFTEGQPEAEFLRRYGLGPILSSNSVATLQRACALLAVQPGQEARELELTERVEAAASGVTLAKARHRKMILLTVLGRFEEARAADAALAASAPEIRCAALPEAALVASRAGREEAAAAWIEEAIRYAPGDERVRRLGGWCWLILGENEKAVQQFTAESPGDGADRSASDAAREIDRRLGLSLARTAAGRPREALEVFRPLAAEYPSLMSPELPQRLNWCAVEAKWLLELHKHSEVAAASPALRAQKNSGWVEPLPDYDAGSLGHP